METTNNRSVDAPNETENQKGVENHKKTAKHLEIAAKHHLEAAAHHEKGNHDLAAKSTLIANGHVNIAHETQKEDLKNHVLHNSL